MKGIVSILHHSIPSTSPQRIAEEEGLGWHFRTALALRNYKGYTVICVRPSGDKRTIIKYVKKIPVVLLPTVKISISNRLWRWSELSPSMNDYVFKLVTKHGFIPYIHEYRSLNSELIIRRLIEYPMILQHHGSIPPNPRDILFTNPLKLAKEISKAKRERILRKVRGAIFVLNKAEKEYLENLGVEAHIKVRTMAVDFNKLKLISEEEKGRLRRELKIPENSIVLTSYVGVFREEFSSIKGAHLIAKVWRLLRSNIKKPLTMIVTGLGASWCRELRSMGIRAYGFLPHDHYLDLVKASDIYFLPATISYYYGGLGVSVMEALALGKPVVSPTLIHLPEKNKIKDIGAITPFVDNEATLRIFIKRLAYVIENVDLYKAKLIRQIAYRYYSWESFAKTFEETLRRI